MRPHTRALVAASAFALLNGRKVAGLYDHHAGEHLRIAAECRDGKVQGLDDARSSPFGGTLPELYDEVDRSFVSLVAEGRSARGYDRATGSFYTAEIDDRLVQLYDHEAKSWFAYDVQTAG